MTCRSEKKIDLIKKFIEKLLGKSPSAAKSKKLQFGKREEVGVAVHGIDQNLVDERAQNVVRTLKNAGFEAYIVGGAVRDLMVGLRPKDFDVATNATPEQVKGLFRRAFIIGRRFRIVHVVFGRGRENDVIEVSTFRAYLDNAAAEQVAGNEKTSRSELAGMKHAVDSSGRVLRDNVWGPQEEDAVRRDFTINAMYYDPQTQVVVDYHNGFKDVKNRVIRMIGDPATRYREDPVRIIRAVRFAAKLSPLGFSLENKTAAPLVKSQELLADVPQSRLFDEMLKLFLSGHAIESVSALREQHLHHGLLPMLDVVLEQPMGERFVMLALKNTDDRVLSGKSANPSFLFATLLWHEMLAAWEIYKAEGHHLTPALHMAMNEVIATQAEKLAIHNRYTATMKEIWGLQPRFEQRAGKRPFGLLTHPRYRAAYDFLLLRCESGELPMEIGEWWTAFANAEGDTRAEMLQADTAPKKRRKRNRKKPGNTDVSAAKE